MQPTQRQPSLFPLNAYARLEATCTHAALAMPGNQLPPPTVLSLPLSSMMDMREMRSQSSPYLARSCVEVGVRGVGG